MRSLLLSLAAAALVGLSTQASAQTLGCEVGSANGGIFPTTGTGGGGVYPTTLPPSSPSFTLNVASVPPGATCVTEVKLIGLTHTWMADCHFTLKDPSGVEHNLFVQQGGSCDFGGDYSIQAACTGGNAWPATCINPVPVGAYDQHFGTWPSGTNSIFNTPLNSIAAATGTWTLTIYDWAGGDSGTLASFDVCFGTPQAPAAPTSAPTLTAPAAGGGVFGPNVSLSWTAAGCATSHDIDVDGTVYTNVTSPFVFASTPGLHTWTVRGTNASGTGPWAASRQFTDLGTLPQPCSGTDLNTIYLGTNGGSVGGAVFFDLNVTAAAGINVSQLDVNTTTPAGTAVGLTVYIKSGSYVGFETNQAAFNVAAVGGGVTAGTDQHTLIEFPDFFLAPGTYGVALVASGFAHRYTNGNGTNQVYSNADVTLTAGKAMNVPFSGSPFSPRVFNGTLRYNCTPPTPPVVTYCTGGTTTNGCVASISADAQPSVTAANACNIAVANVEGQKSGLIFYSITGQSGTAWNATSFLCVKAPTQRTGTQVSGGTVGACDGALSLDWNAYQAANPTALGNPFSAGNKVQIQAWFRDPPAGKSTNLSNAVELTYVP